MEEYFKCLQNIGSKVERDLEDELKKAKMVESISKIIKRGFEEAKQSLEEGRILFTPDNIREAKIELSRK